MRKKTTRENQKAISENAVRFSLPQGLNGPLNLQINFALAPVPDNYYYASTLSLKRDLDHGMVSLSFGRKVEGPGNRLDIVVPEIPLFFGFWNSTRDVEKTIDQQLDATQRRPNAQKLATPETPFVQTLFANAMFISVAVGDCCVDFYYLAPRDIHLARTQMSNIPIYAVIRVVLSPVLAKLLFDLCRPHVGSVQVPGTVAEGPMDASVVERKIRHARNR